MKLRNSFQARISLFLALLLLLVIGAVYFAVKAVTITVASDQAQEQLKTGTRVFERFMDLRWRRIQYGLNWLTNDSDFREATINGSPSLIERALQEFESSLHGSELFVLDLDGNIITSTLKGLPPGQAFPYAKALRLARRNTQTMVIGILAGRPYMLVQGVVLAPLPVVRVVSGMPMDDVFAHELSSLSNLEVSFMTVKPGESGILSSTQPDFMSASIIEFVQEHTPGAAIHFSEFNGQRFLGQMLQLANSGDPDNGQVMAVLQSPLDQTMQAFNSLDRKFLWISLGALLASLLGALWLARAVSRPVSLLAEAAQRIGRGNYETRVELTRRDELGFLARAINAMQSGIAVREQQLAHNALHDPLTGLPNRALAMERLGSAISARRSVVLIYLGIENYRVINEGFGPEGVELIMRESARVMLDALRERDTAARITGNEFLLLLESTQIDVGVAMADRLYALLKRPLSIDGHEVALEVCMGIAVYPLNGQSAEELINRAAIARRDAAALPGYLQVYQQDRDLAHQRHIQLIRDLRSAASEGQLQLHYQPKLDIRSGHVRQAEALLRWQHPELGMVSPAEFIPLAERTGSMFLLTGWVIEEGIRQLAEWNRKGMHLQLSLNISAEDLHGENLLLTVERLLKRYQLSAEQLIFEITESTAMRDPEHSLSVLEKLRDGGISLSVDDFGTGYSSLAHLKRLPVQELKIDQSFIRNLDETSEDAVIVRSTIEMSHNLGLKVVAEGVEYQHTLELLERWHCDTAQGYLISRPMDAVAFEAWVWELRATV
ncbi:putative bifunctional diguanylate cyclase/phosphodiesterase [Pseudomonas fragi]|jgi:diguanylate cyclase|uniref:cyclic-guanylate-specific phosphodiesterase n=1 Tax=Pseudomonas fragi TaxID=296 RepID=A0A9Q5FQ25_PSEFR|nr:GGDEF domain-containing protein [Pseudomonas fragi]MBM1199657.1 GGDEF domain-containing protein [Pseudomonas fragi]MBM1206648.1 GGDEF domain-containing protein [Pseudomonas fragi]MDE4513212.1 GGDEF domain-containing protein [Pseudomonas fragi]NNA85157.1 GGDEF domain-containing protein [Pseudomonas fragi]NNB00204.1 GGDEF domain-containing protein [Pseudomonas fragi]